MLNVVLLTHAKEEMMGGDDLNDAVLDDWVHLDDEVLVDEDDGADATESGEERDWRIY